MADMSPMCSIMVARAMGAMTRMAVTSNLASWKGGRPTRPAWATAVKSIRGWAVPSAPITVTPQAFMMRAAM